MALSDTQKETLDRRLLLRHRLEQYYVNGFGRMVVSWSTHGIVDLDTEVNARLIILDVNTSTELIDRVYTKDEAFDEHYRTTVNEWNLNHTYEVSITIDDYTKSMTVKPYAGLPKGVRVDRFDPRTTRVEVKNTDEGIRFSLCGCSGQFRKNVRNVIIQRCSASLSTPVDKYMSAVPIPVELPTNALEFSSVLYNGVYLKQNNLFEINDTFNKRQKLALAVSLIDSGTEYVEITDQEIIDSYPEHRKITVLGELNETQHNRANFLYQKLQSSGGYLYFQYRGKTMFIPHQKITGDVSYEMGHTFINYLDPDGDGRAHIYFPADKRIADETTLSVTFSYRDRNNNILEFGGTPETTDTLETYLPSGVTFMDGFSFHTDTDVQDGSWYYYNVVVETWDNKRTVIFDDYIPRELIPLENFTHLTTEDLMAPVDEKGIKESDLQSGVAPNELLVKFSDDPADERRLSLYEKFKVNCKDGK